MTADQESRRHTVRRVMRGTTLIETMVAVGLFAVGLTAALSGIHVLMRASNHTRLSYDASMVAQKWLLDVARPREELPWDFPDESEPYPVDLDGNIDSNGPLRVKWVFSPVAADPAHPEVNMIPGLRRVHVEVTGRSVLRHLRVHAEMIVVDKAQAFGSSNWTVSQGSTP